MTNRQGHGTDSPTPRPWQESLRNAAERVALWWVAHVFAPIGAASGHAGVSPGINAPILGVADGMFWAVIVPE